MMALSRSGWAASPAKPGCSRPVTSSASKACGKVIRAVVAPSHPAVFQADIVRMADAEARVAVRLDAPASPWSAGCRRGRPYISSSGRGSQRRFPGAHRESRLWGVPLTRTLFSARPVTFRTRTSRIVPTLVVRRARDGGEGDRLAAAPPRVGVVARDELDVAEIDIEDVALVAELDAQPAAARHGYRSARSARRWMSCVVSVPIFNPESCVSMTAVTHRDVGGWAVSLRPGAWSSRQWRRRRRRCGSCGSRGHGSGRGRCRRNSARQAGCGS